ncbi:MAG: hypothetical protein ABJG88_05275 [Litorimonas sp.]
MTHLTYRILGYNLDFGVIRIEGLNSEPRNVVIFASQSIQGHLHLNADEVLFISKTGEVVKLNLTTAEITQKAKLFSHYNSNNRLFPLSDGKSVVSLSTHEIAVIDYEALTVKRTFNVAIKDKDGILRLKNYDDIKAPYEAEAAAEYAAMVELQKTNPSGPWPQMKWMWASKLLGWPGPANGGDAFRLFFNTKLAAIRPDGTLIASSSKETSRTGQSSERSGLIRINLQTDTCHLVMFEETDDQPCVQKLILKTISSDGMGLLMDGYHIIRHEETPQKSKRLFGFSKVQSKPIFEHRVGLWRIEDTLRFDHHISMGTTPAILQPEEPSEDRRQKYPTLYESDLIDIKIEALRLEVARAQFNSVYDTMTWSEEVFKSDFKSILERENIVFTDCLSRQFKNNKLMHFGASSFVVENFLNEALEQNPNFVQDWQTKPLNKEQAKTFESIPHALSRLTKSSSKFAWGSIDDDIYILQKQGELKVLSPATQLPMTYLIEGLPLGVNSINDLKFSDKSNTRLQITWSLGHGSKKDCLLIDLPLKASFKGEQNTLSTFRIYDVEAFKQEHELAEKLSRKARKGYVPIRSKSSANLLKGLVKLTTEYAKYHEEIILSDRWDAGLFYKKSLVLEHEIARILVKEKDPTALPVLTAFVETVMGVAAKDVSPIPPFPRDLKTGHIAFSVFHTDDGTQVGMPSVNALIALSDNAPELALTFYRYRDFEHDVYTHDEGLLKDVLPHVSLDKPGVLKLLAITAFQFLATGRAQDDLFVQHGMERVAAALNSGTLSPKLAAQIFVEEVKGLEGNLSWGDNLGPHGLVAQAVYGLDKNSKGKQAFGEAMLELYPEAKTYLLEKTS